MRNECRSHSFRRGQPCGDATTVPNRQQRIVRLIKWERHEQGAALVVTFFMMLILAGLALAVGVFSQNSLVGGRSQLLDKQVFYIAEAGWQRARQALVAGTWTAATSPGNTYTEAFGAGQYQVTVVDNGNGTYTITSNGYVPSQSAAIAKRKVAETAVTATVSNGTNRSLAATGSASSSSGPHTAAKANDGDTGTNWQSSTKGSGSWLAMDYGSASTLSTIIIKENDAINGLSIEWSDDASSWTTASGQSVVESPSKTWTATFTAASHRYFRSNFTDVPSNKKAAVDEMESYNATVSLGTAPVTTQW